MEGSGGAEVVDLMELDGAVMAATHAEPAGNAGTALDAAEEGMAVAVAGSEATCAAAAHSGKKRLGYWGGWATRFRVKRVKKANATKEEEAAAAANSAVGTPSLSVPVEAVSDEDEEEAASAAAATSVVPATPAPAPAIATEGGPALKPDDATPEIEPLNAPPPALESLSAEQRARIEENKQSAKKRKLLLMAKKKKGKGMDGSGP